MTSADRAGRFGNVTRAGAASLAVDGLGSQLLPGLRRQLTVARRRHSGNHDLTCSVQTVRFRS